ncbi:hypothetical protein IV203_021716 [Nitzschia inconspicua]|uniref:Uncharacterized protein n=1 Tax=Nitzschia inconspicua TaxID=303405 RepID=A0A9K3PDN5_9STRA|nr:hypothetical protein IV203_021716 [Nitzschia inconspicua]
MPKASSMNPEEIDVSNSHGAKRVLEDDPSSSSSPSDLISTSKKQKIDKDEIPVSAPSTTPNHIKGIDTGKTTIDGPKKVDPTELASAFALASLANLHSPSTREETRDVKQGVHTDQAHDGVRVMASWDETRSPKADHQPPHSPEQRSPGSAAGMLYTPPSAITLEDRNTSGGSRKVTFAPNTKETSSPGTPMRLRLAASRRLVMPSHRAPMPNNDNGMVVSPRPHRMYGGMRPPYLHTPPHMPTAHFHHGPPPPPPHQHSAYHHHHHPGHLPRPGAFHHTSPNNYGSPGGGSYWHGGPPRMGIPPRHLLQPPLKHRSVDPVPSKVYGSNQWICDFCNVASFGTYEEACIHEESCKLRVLSMSSSGEDRSIATSRSRSMDEDAIPAEALSSRLPINVKDQDWYDGTMSLAMDESDHDWLPELNCYIRKCCIEVFSATPEDVACSRNRVTLQQVGVRCCFCAPNASSPSEEAQENKDDATQAPKIDAAVSYPATVGGIYEAAKRWHRVHAEVCPYIPETVRDEMSSLATSNVWFPTTRQYWADAARALGLVDTNEGIRFGEDPSKVCNDVKRISRVPSGEEFPPHLFSRGMGYPVPPRGYYPVMMLHPTPPFVHPGMVRMDHLQQAAQVLSHDNHMPPPPNPVSGPAAHANPVLRQQHMKSLGGHIVFQEDMEMIPPYVYFLMRQVEPCLFTEADRFVARSKGPVGYPGFQCRHCNGHAGLGKYFPISSKSLSTNSTSQNIHAHLLKCRKCPDVVKDRLVQLKIEKSRAPRLEPGWRKIFFDKVWARLHRPGTVADVTSSSSSLRMADESNDDNASAVQDDDGRDHTA